MIIKSRKSGSLIAALVLTATALFFTVDSQTITLASHDVYERYMTLQPGFSSARNLSDTGGLIQHQTVFTKAGTIISSIPRSLLSKKVGTIGVDIERLDIVIKFSNYKKILEDRRF